MQKFLRIRIFNRPSDLNRLQITKQFKPEICSIYFQYTYGIRTLQYATKCLQGKTHNNNKKNYFLQFDFRVTVLSQAERCPEQRWVKADFFLVLQYDNSESQ